MNAEVNLTGYDKHTEFLSVAPGLPKDLVDFARGIAGVPESDPDVIRCLPAQSAAGCRNRSQGALPAGPRRI